jgi:hypothetical protein
MHETLVLGLGHAPRGHKWVWSIKFRAQCHGNTVTSPLSLVLRTPLN